MSWCKKQFAGRDEELNNFFKEVRMEGFFMGERERGRPTSSCLFLLTPPMAVAMHAWSHESL